MKIEKNLFNVIRALRDGYPSGVDLEVAENDPTSEDYKKLQLYMVTVVFPSLSTWKINNVSILEP